MVASKEARTYREDVDKLNKEERERLLKPYLPSSPTAQTTRRMKSQPIRSFLKAQLHFLVFTAIHVIFSLYVRLRQAYHVVVDRIFAILYYHHRAPELIKQDIRGLNRLPRHLSVILELKVEEHGLAVLEGLLDEVAEISAWCACAGIKKLSVYEKSGQTHHLMYKYFRTSNSAAVGILKNHIPRTHRKVSSKFHGYFGRVIPTLEIQAPHMSSFLNEIEQETSAGRQVLLYYQNDCLIACHRSLIDPSALS